MRMILRQLEEAAAPKGPKPDPKAFVPGVVKDVGAAFAKAYGVKLNQLPGEFLRNLTDSLKWGAEEAFKLVGNENEAEVDFDLTAFKPGAWEKLIKRHGIVGGERSKRSLGGLLADRFHNFFLWTGDGITVETNNNPITGEFNTPEDREPEKGYASYVSVKGKPDKVKKFVADFRKTAEYIKGEKND